MEDIQRVILEAKEEIWIGLATFIIGYMTHRREVKEHNQTRQQKQHDSEQRWFEVELEHLVEKQQSIQDYMERSIERLESDKVRLTERIIALEDKIDKLERENYECKFQYEALLRETERNV